SLKLAQLKREQQDYKDRVQYLKEEISKFDQDEDISEIEEELDQTKRKVLGYFQQAIESIDKEKQSVLFERNPIERQM
ncbi:hypothetical protein, partial [Pseudomonas sp. 2822-17]|uniref:hypothetical protein n=1 Tax=Pseudomonas sp. 2822-17 TaxID=1712678 RepID=UPI000C5DDAD1